MNKEAIKKLQSGNLGYVRIKGKRLFLVGVMEYKQALVLLRDESCSACNDSGEVRKEMAENLPDYIVAKVPCPKCQPKICEKCGGSGEIRIIGPDWDYSAPIIKPCSCQEPKCETCQFYIGCDIKENFKSKVCGNYKPKEPGNCYGCYKYPILWPKCRKINPNYPKKRCEDYSTERPKPDAGEFVKLTTKDDIGPHGFDAKNCPTFYDGCHCTVETLEHNIDRCEQLTQQIAELKAKIKE